MAVGSVHGARPSWSQLPTSAFGTGDGAVRVLDDEVRVSVADAGPLKVGFSVPAETRAIGAVLRVDGPAIESARAPGLEGGPGGGSVRDEPTVIVAGPISGGTVVELLTPPGHGHEPVPSRASAGGRRGTYALDDLEDYGAAIER